MKKNYACPELEVVELLTEDILASSNEGSDVMIDGNGANGNNGTFGPGLWDND